MFDFLLTMLHYATWLHKLLPHLHLKTPKNCAFSFSEIRVMFQYYFLLPLCSIALFQRVVINFTPSLISFSLYLWKKKKKTKIKSFWFFTLGTPLSVRYWLARYCTILLTGAVTKFARLNISFKKKKKKPILSFYFVYTLFEENFSIQAFLKSPQTKNPTNPRPHA